MAAASVGEAEGVDGLHGGRAGGGEERRRGDQRRDPAPSLTFPLGLAAAAVLEVQHHGGPATRALRQLQYHEHVENVMVASPMTTGAGTPASS